MYLIAEILSDEASMTARVIGITADLKMARKVMVAARRKFYKTLDKDDYVGFRYTTRGDTSHMMWVDVVCSSAVYGNTWVALDSNNVGSAHGRYLG